MTEKNKENREDTLEEIEAELVEDEEELVDDGHEDDLEKESSDEAAQLKESLARLQADFINYKNRTEKEKTATLKYANERLIEKLLSVKDNFDRALDNADREDSFVEGIILIKDEFEKILEAEGLEEIDSNQVKFDPNMHHAVFIEESEDVASEHIIETFQKGYMLDGRVIRPAMVKVAK